MDWPDVAVGMLVGFGTLRGWRVGLIAELTGILALAAALGAAFSYSGFWDDAAGTLVHAGSGSRHVVGLLAYAGSAYLAVSALGLALARVATLPLLGLANGALGATLGLVKAALFVWALLYVALFFPLSDDLRADLHRSFFVTLLCARNDALDASLRASLPPYMQFLANDLFTRHHV